MVSNPRLIASAVFDVDEDGAKKLEEFLAKHGAPVDAMFYFEDDVFNLYSEFDLASTEWIDDSDFHLDRIGGTFVVAKIVEPKFIGTAEFLGQIAQFGRLLKGCGHAYEVKFHPIVY